MKKSIISLLILFFLSLKSSCHEKNEIEIIPLDPEINSELLAKNLPALDKEATIASLRKAGGLYTMVFYGDYKEILDFNQQQMKNQQVMRYFLDPAKLINRNKFNCSMFSYYGKPEAPLFGRNFDNRYSELLVGFYFPEEGYASIAFTPMMLYGFDEKKKMNMSSSLHTLRLIHSPFFTIEGMNEKGITLGLASVTEQKLVADKNKESRYLLCLVREILDHAGSLDEAIDIATRYNVFDSNINTLAHHIFIAGPSGRSAVLELHAGRMQIMHNEHPWQIVTNSCLYNVPQNKRCDQCSRYNRAFKKFDGLEEDFTWKQGMDLLERIEQVNQKYVIDSRELIVSTQWSAVFDMKTKEVYICLLGDYERVYKIKLKNRDYYTKPILDP